MPSLPLPPYCCAIPTSPSVLLCHPYLSLRTAVPSLPLPPYCCAIPTSPSVLLCHPYLSLRTAVPSLPLPPYCCAIPTSPSVLLCHPYLSLRTAVPSLPLPPYCCAIPTSPSVLLCHPYLSLHSRVPYPPLLSKTKRKDIICLHRLPSSGLTKCNAQTFITEFSDLLEEYVTAPGNLLITEHFNFRYDQLNSTNVSRPRTVLHDNRLRQVIRQYRKAHSTEPAVCCCLHTGKPTAQLYLLSLTIFFLTLTDLTESSFYFNEERPYFKPGIYYSPIRWVERLTEKPGAILTRVPALGAAKAFSPRVTFHCNICVYNVKTKQKIKLKIKNGSHIPLFGHTKILHKLVGMGSATLAAVVS